MGSQICLPNIFLMEMYAEIKTLKYFFSVQEEKSYMLSLQRNI